MKEKFIPGIYNYCDRWCERCSLTSRCRNFELTGRSSAQQNDITNKAFWDTVSANLRKGIRLLHKAAKKYGIDLDKPISPEEQKEIEEKESFVRNAVIQHSLIVCCRQYRDKILPFLKEGTQLSDKARELVTHLQLGIKTREETDRTARNIQDCLNTIQWYIFFIDAKLARALRGKFDGEEWAIENGFQKDSDGSAKIARIAIERSIGAWSRLHEFVPAVEDAALGALSLLSQLKEKLDQEFPDATQFKRPGFDDD